jgi:hypothetical protein
MNESKPFGPPGDEGASGALRARFARPTLPFPSPRPSPLGRGRMVRRLWAMPATEFAKPVCVKRVPRGGCSLSPRERVRVRGIGLPLDTATRTIPQSSILASPLLEPVV